MNLEPYDKTPTQNRCGIWAVLLLIVLIVAAGLALMGCSYARSGDSVAWCWTTGNRTALADTNGATVIVTDIAENLTAAAPIAEAAAKGAAKGLVPIP